MFLIVAIFASSAHANMFSDTTITHPLDGVYVGGLLTVQATSQSFIADSNFLVGHLKVDNGTEANVTVTAVSPSQPMVWLEYNLDTASYADGEHNITVTGTWDTNIGELTPTDTVTITVDNTAPTVDWNNVDYNATTKQYSVTFIMGDANPYGIYVGVVGRTESCADANYAHIGDVNGGGSSVVTVSVDFPHKVCVSAVDAAGNVGYDEYLLPEPIITIYDPEGFYTDEWPEFSGQFGNYMQDTVGLFGNVQCGPYYWDGNQWTTSDTNFSLEPFLSPPEWDFVTTLPPVEGNCVFTVYHVTEVRGTATDQTTFLFDKSPPTVDFGGFVLGGSGWIAQFHIEDDEIEGYGPTEVDIGVASVPRDGNCETADYSNISSVFGQADINEPIDYNEMICVRAIDIYGQEDFDVAQLPAPVAHIDVGGWETNYFNDFPEGFSGTLENWMEDSSVAIIFECNGPNGHYWYDGHEWDANYAEFEPDHDDEEWEFGVEELPPTLGSCKLTVLHRATYRPTGGAAEGFEFNATEPAGMLVLDDGEPVTNGCGDESPEWCDEEDRDIEVHSELNGWGPINTIEVMCNDGNWFEVDSETYEDAYGHNWTSIYEMSEFVDDGEDFYYECMQEGTVTLTVHVVDYFGRETTFSDDIEYHKNAWAIEYELRDREDEEWFRPAMPEDEPEWYFIGVPVIPYTEEMNEVMPEGIDSVWLYTENGWKVYRPEHPELSDLNAFEQGKAYMIRVDWNGLDDYPEFTIWGYCQPETNTNPPMPSVIFTVHSGWNPVAFDLRPYDGIDAGTAFSALTSKEVYTLGDAWNSRDYSGRYWAITVTGGPRRTTPVFSRKGYWVYTTEDNVDVHSKYRSAEGGGWWR
ncbi:MAG: hypothetical protein PWP76_362 [Candidatus Diapherotrites archaeon]|nr:hypothetical protein [Candidatus Diapherotrites archaeon]